MNKAATSKVGSSLIARKLMREIRAKAGMPVWRQDGEGSPISLMITKAGRKAIGVEEAAVPDEKAAARKKTRPRRSASENNAASDKSALRSDLMQRARAGSKQALVVGMLSEKSGATLNALVEATGWLPHTTRAAITGLRKRGFSVERSREGEISVYRIVETAA